MCFSIHKTHTNCGHITRQEWLCKAGYKRQFKAQHSFKRKSSQYSQKKEPVSPCPSAKKDKIKIEFGFCQICAEHRYALGKECA